MTLDPVTYCTMCEKDLTLPQVITCPACFNPFGDCCYYDHFGDGYHIGIHPTEADLMQGEPGEWVQDGIHRPTSGGFTKVWGMTIDTWILGQEPESWGHWRAI